MFYYSFAYDKYNPNQPRDEYGRWAKSGAVLSTEIKNIIKHFPETLNKAVTFALTGQAVAEISGKEFQKDGIPLTDKVSAYYKQVYNNQVENAELGTVILDLQSVKSDIAHGLGALKAAAFAAVPQVIQKGFIFDRQQNWKNRGYETFVLIAPVIIDGKRYAEEVIVKKTQGKQSLYLHEVEIQKNLESFIKTVPPAYGHSPVSTASNVNEGTEPASKLIITKKIEDYKPIPYGQDRYICRLEIRTLLREILAEEEVA